jgi:formylmethanofuran dehydrogenase subunit E
MKKININNKYCEAKNCEACKKRFLEEELNLYEGRWLCNDCEEHISQNK